MSGSLNLKASSKNTMDCIVDCSRLHDIHDTQWPFHWIELRILMHFVVLRRLLGSLEGHGVGYLKSPTQIPVSTAGSARLQSMKRTLGAGMDKTTNKEMSMGIAMDFERNSKKRKIVKECRRARKAYVFGGESGYEGMNKSREKSKKTKKEKQKIERQIPRFMPSSIFHPNRAKVVTLLVPGITPDVLNINIEAGTSKNPNLPMTIPFAAGFIPNTFSHACPTRAPGDQSRMFSVLGIRIDQMVQNGYPIPSYVQGGSKKEEGEGWIEVPMEEEGEKKGRKAYGIDYFQILPPPRGFSSARATGLNVLRKLQIHRGNNA
ncbi:hypothetical protein EV360DRAFT_73302 [Lentinula raphanica]|nr:hypothetical protein EV360DRAFT_73302 [Lentinula raphanica]